MSGSKWGRKASPTPPTSATGCAPSATTCGLVRQWRARLRTIARATGSCSAAYCSTRGARAPKSPGFAWSAKFIIATDRGRIRPKRRRSARSPAQDHQRRASPKPAPQGPYASPIHRRQRESAVAYHGSLPQHARSPLTQCRRSSARRPRRHARRCRRLGVVRRAHSRKPGKAAATRVPSLPANPASPRPSRSSSMNVAEPGLFQNLVDDRVHSGDRSGELDMDIRRRAARLGERVALRVASRARQRVAPPSTRDRAARWSRRFALFQSVEHHRGGDAQRVRRFGRREPLSARPWRRLLGRHWQMHKDGGDRRPLVAEILQRPEVEVVANESAGVPRHPRRNSRLFNRSRYCLDRRRRLEPFRRGAGDPERPSQGAVIVRRGGVVKIVREPLDANDSARAA